MGIHIGMPEGPEHPQRRRAAWWSGAFMALLVGGGCTMGSIFRGAAMPKWVEAGYWLVVGGVGLVALMLWVVAAMDGTRVPLRRVRRYPKSYTACPRCQYAFDGLKDVERCPECGWELPYAVIMERILRRKRENGAKGQ